MLQNTLVVSILKHFTVCTWIFNISLQKSQHFGIQLLAIKPTGTKLFEFHWKYKELSILNAICQSLMNILALKRCELLEGPLEANNEPCVHADADD